MLPTTTTATHRHLLALLRLIAWLKECDMQDDTSKALYQAYLAHELNKATEYLKKTRFWQIGEPGRPAPMLYDHETRRLWQATPDEKTSLLQKDAEQQLQKTQICGLGNWRLPSKDEITDFASAPGNPLRSGQNSRLRSKDYWLCSGGRVDLDNGSFSVGNSTGALIVCNHTYVTSEQTTVLLDALRHGWTISACGSDGTSDLLARLRVTPKLQALYKEIDYRICRLPRLESTQFSDPNKGLWEFWDMAPEVLAEQKLRARNPVSDIKDWNIAIDFGTSSTVVAYDDNGNHKLLRIGAKDYWEKELPEHYENPTVLEFVDFQATLASWQSEVYRPNLNWDHVRCSHEALHNLRNNGSEPRIVASVLSKLKQWALRQAKDGVIRLVDQKHRFEHELALLCQRNPVKGQPLTTSNDAPFDPVELYAWYLGMTINWRQRGLFLRYYLTFPVAYPREVKENLLTSFRRGLQRSLPASLTTQTVFQNFSVEELANEPAAYAAAALPKLGLNPTQSGLAYAVFDFGGGTTDFDFGYYRLPSADEEDEGWEEVIEHCGNGGDPYLGGENLLENLAYRVFQHNLDICRKEQIVFTRPQDADDFPGAEMFLNDTQAASTNTVMLISHLRPLWEEQQMPGSSGVLKLGLLDTRGNKKDCELLIPQEVLQGYLYGRIEDGLKNFFIAMRKAFAAAIPAEIHVLLAGNSSRSQILGAFFELTTVAPGTPLNEEAAGLAARKEHLIDSIFGPQAPHIVIHPPLTVDPEQPYSPTGKTGVALGLLRLAPGGPIKVIQPRASTSHDEAPFAHYVGRVRQSRFQPGLHQADAYQVWKEIGVPRDRVFNLFHTQSPKAHAGEMCEGEPGLYKMRLDFSGETQGHRVFARPLSPSRIELCTAASADALGDGEYENLREIELA